MTVSLSTDTNAVVINNLLQQWLRNQSRLQHMHMVISAYHDILAHSIHDIDRKLLTKCCKLTWRHHRAITMKILKFIGDIYSKSLLINICAHSKSDKAMKTAMKAFKSIAHQEQNAISVTAMLQCFINHHRYQRAIDLYEQFAHLKYDDVSDSLYLRACIDHRQYEKGAQLLAKHEHLRHLHRHKIQLINTAIDFYGACGDMEKAQHLFHAIPKHKLDVITVTSMLKTFIGHSCYGQAVQLYHQFADHGIRHDDVSNALCLKACVHANEYEYGQRVIDTHYLAPKQGHRQRCSIQFITAIIEFYGRFGRVRQAMNVFEAVPPSRRDAILVNEMMKCLLANDVCRDAIVLFEQCVDSQLDEVSNVLFLKACANGDCYDKGRRLIEHAHESSSSIEWMSSVIDFYGQFGYVAKAQSVFESITAAEQQNIVAVGAMLKCFCNSQRYSDAIALYDRVTDEQTLLHNDTTTTLFLKACTKMDNYEKARKVIDTLDHRSLHSHSIELLTTIIDFHGYYGEWTHALAVFDAIPMHMKNTVCVNAMLKCYVQHACHQDAIAMYEQLGGNGSCGLLDDVSHTLYLRACTNGNEYAKGKHFIDTHYNRQHFSCSEEELLSTMIDFYSKFDDVPNAKRVFDGIADEHKNIFCVNAMLKCLIHNGQSREAITLFDARNDCIEHDDVSPTLYLKACTNARDFDKGLQLLNELNDRRHHSIEFLTTVIEFYGKSGRVLQARQIFDSIPAQQRNIVCVGAMMHCYVSHGEYRDAIQLYEKYKSSQIAHNDVTNTLLLKACMKTDSVYDGQEQQVQALIQASMYNLNQRSIEFITTIIDFYGHAGKVQNALNVFNLIVAHRRDATCFGAMMNVYNMNEQWDDALQLFDDIPCQQRTAFLYSIALDTCSGAVALAQGNAIIETIEHGGDMLCRQPIIQAAIIRFYAKTDQSQKAIAMFDAMSADISAKDREGVIYQAIMDCYAKIGATDKLLSLFETLQKQRNMNMSQAMYSIVLSGCAHSGMLDEAQRIFADVINARKLDANIIVTMLDGYARSNDLSQAQQLYDTYKHCKLDMKSRLIALCSILSACRTHNDLSCAEKIFANIQTEFLPCLHSNDVVDAYMPVIYNLMGNIYGQQQMFEKQTELKMEMKQRDMQQKKI